MTLRYFPPSGRQNMKALVKLLAYTIDAKEWNSCCGQFNR
jgi:hypothetical protein